MVIRIVISVRIVTCAITRFIEVFHFNLARDCPSLAAKRSLRFRFALRALEFPFQNAHGRILAVILEHEEHLVDNTSKALHCAIVIHEGLVISGLSKFASTGQRAARATRMDFNLVTFTYVCGLDAEVFSTLTEVHARNTNPRFATARKRQEHMHNGLALSPVRTATDVHLLGTRRCLVGLVRVKVLDLLRSFAGEGELVHLVATPGEFVDGHASVVFVVRVFGTHARLSRCSRVVVRSHQATIVINGIPLVLERSKALVVVTTFAMSIRHRANSRNDRTHKGIRTPNIVGHTIVNNLATVVEAQVISVPLLVQVRSFERVRQRDLLQ